MHQWEKSLDRMPRSSTVYMFFFVGGGVFFFFSHNPYYIAETPTPIKF